MTAVDTSSLIAYLAGEVAPDTDALDVALANRAAILPPVVLAEVMSAPRLDAGLRETLLEVPMLEVGDGYWARAGLLRAQVRARGLKARLADSLVAQSCIDHRIGLITRDRDFRHYVRHGLVLVISLVFFLATGLSAQNARGGAQGPDAPQQHEFVFANFKTESGVTLPQAKIVYGTYGHLNAAGDNAVLLPSHYMANWRGYGWIIGADKALDPSKLFLVATELFGNGRSSSPSNTPEPFHGPRFPVTTIRDNVQAVHTLLTQELKITHLRAIVGFSMGAEQAFQWAVSFPTFASRIVATSGTAKCYPHGIVRLEGEIDAITSDPVFQNGDYTTPPAKGIETFGTVWLGWLYSQEWWRRELWRTGASATLTFDQYFQNARTHFLNNADANDLILQMRTWEKHDVGTTPGFNGSVEAALKSIKVPILYMPSETDMYFPLTDARYEAAFIPGVTLMPIPSLWGHPAGAAASPADAKFLNDEVSKFLAK